MFKSKYIKSLSASIILASSILVATNAEASKNFTDLNSDPSHAQAVKVLNSYDIFDYKTGTTLNGNAEVSRAEVAKVLHNLFGDLIAPERKYNNNFKDVNSKTKFYEDIVWAYESKIFDGDNSGNFNPSQTLTRAQMAKVLVNAFLLETDGTSKFNDVSTNHWAYEYINILGAEGFSVGSNGNFMPEKKVTLNQLSTFLWRIEGEPGILDASQPNDSKASVEAVDFKSYDEVKQLALDLYNSGETKETKIVVFTKDSVGERFHAELFPSYDLTSELKGYTKNYGRQLTVSSWEVDGKDYYETEIILDYNSTFDEEDQILLNNKTKAAIEYIKSNYDTSTDYNKVKAVAEFLSSQLTYGQPVSDSNPYLHSVLNVTCGEYTDAAQILFNALGLESRIVIGKANGLYGTDRHAWNAVKVDGQWYYSDMTFYDGGESFKAKHLLMSESELATYAYKNNTSFKASTASYNK